MPVTFLTAAGTSTKWGQPVATHENKNLIDVCRRLLAGSFSVDELDADVVSEFVKAGMY